MGLYGHETSRFPLSEVRGFFYVCYRQPKHSMKLTSLRNRSYLIIHNLYNSFRKLVGAVTAILFFIKRSLVSYLPFHKLELVRILKRRLCVYYC